MIEAHIRAIRGIIRSLAEKYDVEVPRDDTEDALDLFITNISAVLSKLKSDDVVRMQTLVDLYESANWISPRKMNEMNQKLTLQLAKLQRRDPTNG